MEVLLCGFVCGLNYTRISIYYLLFTELSHLNGINTLSPEVLFCFFKMVAKGLGNYHCKPVIWLIKNIVSVFPPKRMDVKS